MNNTYTQYQVTHHSENTRQDRDTIAKKNFQQDENFLNKFSCTKLIFITFSLLLFTN